MRRVVAIPVAAVLLAGLGGTSTPADGAGQTAHRRPFATKTQTFTVPTKYGRIYVEVARPVTSSGKTVKAPAIFTYSPYSILGRRNGDADHWVPRGYARVWADVVGTGNSGGCWDYGGRAEQRTGHRLVEWIARQSWSTGRVAMIGGSYEGTTATATAVTRPRHLTTIVPEAAIARWYDYAYSGGIRYTLNNEALGHEGPGSATDEGLDTPAGFDFGLAVPPPLDAQSPDWRKRFVDHVDPCERVAHTEHGYDQTPGYGTFWRQRDYLRGAGRIRVPVLVAANWGDWNVKQQESVRLFRALDHSRNRRLFMGTRWQGHGVPGGQYARTVDAWMTHYLKGARNGVGRTPPVTSQMSTSTGPHGWYSGRWPRTSPVTLYAQGTTRINATDYQWRLLPMRPRRNTTLHPGPARFHSAGVKTESHMNHHPRLNHDWFWFESPRLRRDMRVFGAPKVRIFSTVHRRWVTYTPTVVDVDPSQMIMAGGQHVGWKSTGALLSATRGWLDSRYRKGLRGQATLRPGKPFGMTVVEKPQDYTFKKGHVVGLAVATEINEWNVPKPYSCQSRSCPFVTLGWRHGQTRLVLPVVHAPMDPMDLFDMSGGMSHMH